MEAWDHIIERVALSCPWERREKDRETEHREECQKRAEKELYALSAMCRVELRGRRRWNAWVTICD